MRRFGLAIAASILGMVVLVGATGDAWAWRARGGWGGWHGTGWHGTGWHGTGWHGAGWRGGWYAPGWRAGWGWNRGYGWRSGWWPGYAGLGIGWAATSPYWGGGWGYGSPYNAYTYGWPYDGFYNPGYYSAYTYPRSAPVVTGRSATTGNIGMHCTTSVKTCLLKQSGYIGGGCSCKVTGGRARGTVTP